MDKKKTFHKAIPFPLSIEPVSRHKMVKKYVLDLLIPTMLAHRRQ